MKQNLILIHNFLRKMQISALQPGQMSPPTIVQQKIEDYFKTLSPLAEKVCNDIDGIADAYAHLWHGFSLDEQQDVINVTLIKPDIVLKYINDISNERQMKKRRSSTIPSKDDATIITDTDSNNDRLSLSSSNSNSYRSTDFSHIYLYNGKDLFTYGQVITALRYNQDDLCGIYRDEHSEPFNPKTKSQMNLNFSQSSADAARIERAQKKYSEVKLPFSNGFDAVDGIVKKPGVDHIPELCAKLASMNASNEHTQDSRRSFMSKLFSSKTNTLPVKFANPKSVPIAADTVDGIHLHIHASKNFDSMSTKSAGSCGKRDEPNDLSRLIDTNDDDDDDDVRNDNIRGNIFNRKADYDFLNNW